MDDFILLCGLGKVGFSILELLHSLGERVVVVTLALQPDWARRAESMAERLILGDARLEDVLADAGIRRAQAVIIVTNDDLVNLEIALDSKRLAPGIAVVVRLYDEELARRVGRDLGVRAVLNAATLSAPAFVAAALGDDILRAFEIDGSYVNIVTLRCESEASGAGLTLREFTGRIGAAPIELSHGERRHSPVVSLDTVLAPGDEVVVAASRQALNALQHGEHGDFSFSHTHEHDAHARTRRAWMRPRAGILRLTARIWRNASIPLKIGFLLLNLFVLVSTLVFHFGMNLSWLNAFYFTITIMTTVGFGDLHLIDQPAWIKLFGCLMMVGGAAMMIVFFSIITDYLVRQRVEQLIGPRRTTLSNHVIVAGLGNVGYRVAVRLHELGEPVLAIERNVDSAFAARLPAGVAVARGDASQAAVLEEAGIERARAVVATTEDDLVNLRIAHTAESMNSSVRTVVRLFQSALAGKLGSSLLGIDRPLNPSQAAAATFVACALAPNVLQGFTMGDRLLMLRWLDGERLGRCSGLTPLEIRERTGVLALLRKAASESELQPLSPDKPVGKGDLIVALEEYQPATRRTAACELVVVQESLSSL